MEIITLKHLNIQKDTAILFFSRTANEEAAVKVFDSSVSIEGNIKIGAHLIEHTINICKSTGFDIFQYFTDRQSGSSFGERLANAIEDVFSYGYKKLVVLGSDCPFVTSKMIQDASEQIDSDRLVLGPAVDGGVYMMAMSSFSYNREKFINLNWGSSELQSGFVQYAEELDQVIAWMERQFDVDKEQDFKLVLRLLTKNRKLSKILLAIVATKYKFTHIQSDDFYPILFHEAQSLRGPPLAA